VSAATSEDPSVSVRKFVKIVDHVLLVHPGPINKFKFSNSELIGESCATDVDRWILHLIGRSTKEFLLKVGVLECYKIPWCLFSCQSLHRLKLTGCCLKLPTMFEGFKNLKSLDLQLVEVAQDALEKLIFGCPLLEKLRVRDVDTLTEINIHAPNLKFFEIYGEFEGIIFDNTFQLTTILVNSWLEFNSESNQSRLPGYSSNLLRFFDNRPHIQNLVIVCFFLKAYCSSI